MSDKDDEVTHLHGRGDPIDSLINSAQAELDKSKREKVKGKLKSLLEKKEEYTRGAAQIDKEIAKLISDAKAGILPS